MSVHVDPSVHWLDGPFCVHDCPVAIPEDNHGHQLYTKSIHKSRNGF